VETGNFFLAQTEGANLADARNLNVTSAKEGEPAESTANTAPMLDPSPAETITAETQAETTAQATAQATAFEEPASATADDPSAVEAPAAMAAADAASSAEVPAVHTEIEVESRAGDTAQHVPQEDVISAPFPASAEGGEEVIDGQTHEEQKAPQE
jgi:hypothetical protein